MSDIETQVKKAMQEGLDHLKKELKSLRSSRANASMLDRVMVEAYGTQVKLKEVATITIPEARQIVVTPFDVNLAGAIRKGIELANLGINPMIDGKVIRLNIPPMDESVRKQIAKQCKELGERAKISMRDVRRKFNDLLKGQKASGDLTEDQQKKSEKKVQELTDKFCKEIDQMTAEKEKEIMTI